MVSAEQEAGSTATQSHADSAYKDLYLMIAVVGSIVSQRQRLGDLEAGTGDVTNTERAYNSLA